jgi:ABC-type dipeptide/oligopeptide/nickel transport system permease subunit
MSRAPVILLVILASISLAGPWFARSCEEQYRDQPGAGISRQFPLGTDQLGRDRLARVLYGSRLSLLFAPAAAAMAALLALFIGGLAGYAGGWCDRFGAHAIDLILSLPWVFLLISVRALLPLNVSPQASIACTFALLAVLGWAGPARVMRAGARSLRNSDLVLQARACGLSHWRILKVHVAPNLKPVFLAQFKISVPVFILAEANLGMLGLGVSEPLPSWGNLLRDLESQAGWTLPALVPLALLVLLVWCFQFTSHVGETRL